MGMQIKQLGITQWHFSCQWLEIFRPQRYAWINFSIIQFDVEYDKFGPDLEIRLGLLGLYMCFSVALPWTTAESISIREKCDEAQKIFDLADDTEKPGA